MIHIVKLIISFAFLVEGAMVFQKPAKKDAHEYNLYLYENKKIKHTVEVFFLTKGRILFKMQLWDKSSKSLCVLDGQAYSDKLKGVEVDTDENGNAYESTVYNFYNADKSKFASFRFQRVNNLANSKRLQISFSDSNKNSCNFNSSDYILSK